MRKKDETLRETLLDLARGIADTEGIEAVNIRSLAGKAGVATGTVYNYFLNKDEILLALTEEYWRNTLSEMEAAISGGSFCGQLQEIFVFLKERIHRSAGMLMNSLGNVEPAGQAHMLSMLSALEESILRRMERDTRLRGDIWEGAFTKERFAHFIVTNLMTALKEKAPDVDFLLEVIRRVID